MIHFAYIAPRPVLSGVVLDPATITISEKLAATTELRVLADSDIPNTSGYPTIKDYLILEDADGFTLAHLDNTTVITQST